MKLSFLPIALLLMVPSILLPTQSLLLAHAETDSFPTQAHKDAIEQWATVIRRCQTAQVMHEVVELLDKVCGQVKAQHHRTSNELFLNFLRMMHQAAILKEKGLRRHDEKLLKRAEDRVQLAVDWINGRVKM